MKITISAARHQAYLVWLDMTLTFEGNVEKAEAAIKTAEAAMSAAKDALNRIAAPTGADIEEMAACEGYARLAKKMAKRVAKGLPSR